MNTNYDNHTGRRNKEADIEFYRPVIWLWSVTLLAVVVLSFFAYRWNLNDHDSFLGIRNLGKKSAMIESQDRHQVDQSH